MPAGYFNASASIDSLKKFLLNKYSDTLVLSFSNEQVFLNSKKINDLHLDAQLIENEIAEFMMQMEGVSAAVTAHSLKNTEFNTGIRSYIQNGYHLKRSGDVCIQYEPSWIDYRRTGSTHGSAFSYDTHIPLIFYGCGIKKGSTSAPIHITDIAPSIAQMLHIQFPSGCSGQPILKILK
jgi:hypothetical protein